jgi:hypothetical protein
VGGNNGVASGETSPPPEMLTGETVALGWDGCNVAVAVLVTCSVRVKVVVGVQVGDGVADGCVIAAGCGVSVARATTPGRKVTKIRASTARRAQPAKIPRVTRPPPTANNRRAKRRVCRSSAVL